jgi:hypothetical protein
MAAPAARGSNEIEHWSPRLRDLCARVRVAARSALGASDRSSLARPVRAGAGDFTYGLDEASERAVDAWLDETAREWPLSVLTEDAGWRHLGPGPRGTAAPPLELVGFDHGGPRIALDPVDGTRGLMHDLRSAWTVVSCAGPGRGEPRLSELELGIVSEIPDSRAARYRALEALRDGPCLLEERDLAHAAPTLSRELSTDGDERCDHGFFPFFRYDPAQRPAVAAVESDFFARLAREEGADLRHVFDDQYISNAGQLVLLALGTYRMIADLRAFLAQRDGVRTTTSKPYDLAGAVLCAQRAGCVVTAADGSPLDFPLDCATPVHFAGWVNDGTARRLAPHLAAALRSSGAPKDRP